MSAEAHSLKENLGGFFLPSERHIEHQGDNKNWAEELGKKTQGSDTDRSAECIWEVPNIFNSSHILELKDHWFPEQYCFSLVQIEQVPLALMENQYEHKFKKF